jgi:hypothetical protein
MRSVPHLQWQSAQAAEWLQQLLAAVQDVDDALAAAAVQAADSCWGEVCPGVTLLSREGRQVVAGLREFVTAALEEVESAAAGAADGDECCGSGDEQGCGEVD